MLISLIIIIGLSIWFQQCGAEARQITFYVGWLFGYICNSDMHSYYEGRTLIIACLIL